MGMPSAGVAKVLALTAVVGLLCWAGISSFSRHSPSRLNNASNSDLVRVDFYGESLCPDCQHMVRDILQPLFDSGVADLARLRYIAYGKVKDGVCQHGATECKFNRYINCAQAAHADQRDWFPYVRCLADNMRSMDDTADECAAKQGWKPETLSACAGGAQGAALEKEAGAATLALEPKLTFVPWVLVNDVPIGADFENLDRYICAANSGADRPKACYAPTPRVMP